MIRIRERVAIAKIRCPLTGERFDYESSARNKGEGRGKEPGKSARNSFTVSYTRHGITKEKVFQLYLATANK